ncbi:MAG: thiamine pyrophosphate-dependent dehydrogenase E1 component subunit alpha [Thermomicrobiales bacterium]|nr:thiamine pyrophosphate-dependent dehydrogenase E1 component subunit alpha [Thermomicrobiales bacterium]
MGAVMNETELSVDTKLGLFTKMARIRAFERKVQALFKRGALPGFVHLYIGQEAIAVGACSVLRDDDRITSTHRGHGHLIAKGAEVDRMMAELLGRVDGYCKGKGGSMHIVDYELGILGANGIVGGGLPIATGAGLSDRVLGRDAVTVCFFGDGASNQGVLLESLNLSAIWGLPVVYLCENNGYTEWMPTESITAGNIGDRGKPFQIPSHTVDGNDVLAVRRSVDAAVDRARAGGGPSLIEAKTYRHLAHNEGEEAFSGKYRSDEEIAGWIERDPLVGFKAQLIAEGVAESDLDAIETAEKERIDAALEFAERSALPEPADALEDLYAGQEVVA